MIKTQELEQEQNEQIVSESPQKLKDVQKEKKKAPERQKTEKEEGQRAKEQEYTTEQTEQTQINIDREDERLIQDVAKLLVNPRATDNSHFRGREISPQTNETLDLIGLIKKQLENDKVALKKMAAANFSTRDITKKNLGRKGIGPLKGYDVISRTKESVVLLKGRSLYIYELKQMELQPPATGIQQGDKVSLIWPYHVEKARAQVNVPEQRRENAMTRQMQPGVKK